MTDTDPEINQGVASLCFKFGVSHIMSITIENLKWWVNLVLT